MKINYCAHVKSEHKIAMVLTEIKKNFHILGKAYKYALFRHCMLICTFKTANLNHPIGTWIVR